VPPDASPLPFAKGARGGFSADGHHEDFLEAKTSEVICNILEMQCFTGMNRIGRIKNPLITRKARSISTEVISLIPENSQFKI